MLGGVAVGVEAVPAGLCSWRWPSSGPGAAGQAGSPSRPPAAPDSGTRWSGREPSADCGTHSWVAVSCLLLKDIPGRRKGGSALCPRCPVGRGTPEAGPYLGDRSHVEPELSEQAGEVPQSPADLFTFLSTARQGVTSEGDPKGTFGTQGRCPAKGWQLGTWQLASKVLGEMEGQSSGQKEVGSPWDCPWRRPMCHHGGGREEGSSCPWALGLWDLSRDQMEPGRGNQCSQRLGGPGKRQARAGPGSWHL